MRCPNSRRALCEISFMIVNKMAMTDEKRYNIRALFSCIGIFVGLSAGIVFGFKFHNWNVCLWALGSGAAAAVTLYVHLRQKKFAWDTCPERLRSFMLMGCFIQLAGVCGFVTYLTLAIVQKQGLVIEGNGYYLTCVWTFMLLKWGFFLFYYSRQYFRQQRGIYTILPKHDQDESRNSYTR